MYSKRSSTAYRNVRILDPRVVSALNCTTQNDVDCSLIRRKQLVVPRKSTFSNCLAVSAACIHPNCPLKLMCLTEATKSYPLVQVSKTLQSLRFTSIKSLLATIVTDPQESGPLEGPNLMKAGVRCACTIYTCCGKVLGTVSFPHSITKSRGMKLIA